MALNQPINTETSGYSRSYRRLVARNPGYVIVQAALAILRRYGQDAHIYLPGVGMLNGLQAGNYLDSAGTTQGTVDQPVGLALDAVGGLGVELVVNGGFDTDTAWTKTAGWTIASGTGVATAASGASIYQNVLTVGKTYKLTFTVVSIAAGGVIPFIGGGNLGSQVTAVGDYTYIGPCVSNGNTGVSTASGTTCVIDNISVREVTGIAASQPTTASKPILRRGAVNLLTYSGDFSNAAWTGSSTVTRAAGQSDPLGGLNATSIVGVATSFGRLLRNINNTLLASTAYTAYAVVKGNLSNFAGLRLSKSCAATDIYTYWDLTTGAGVTATAQAGSNTGVSSVSLGGGWWLVATNYTTDAAPTTLFDLAITTSTGATAPASSTAESILVYRTGYSLGTLTAAQIQALGGIPLTTTAPASTALGPYFWQFDGSNDSLSLGGPLFQMADDHCVVAGVFNSGTSSYKHIQNVGGNGAGDQMVAALAFKDTHEIYANWRDDANTNVSIASTFTYANSKLVASGRNIGGNKVLRVNGALVASSSVPLGATTTTTASIGAYKGGAPFMNGNIYPVIAIKGTVQDADLLLLERLVGQMSGVTI